jgi:ComEC/Rec2-related protein
LRRSKTKSPPFNEKSRFLLVLLAISALLFWRFSSFLPSETNGYLRLEATLLEEPRVFREWQYFDIDVYRVKASSDIEVRYADKLVIEGEVLDGRFLDPKLDVVGSSRWRKVLFSIRQNLKQRIFSAMSEPQASLLSGVVLGSKEDLPENFTEALRKTGTLHVVVVSGYNISVVAGLLIGLSRFIRRQFAIILALAAITFYTLLVGADPPAVRAAIMGAVGFTAIFLGRQRLSVYSLLIAALFMIFLNPLVLRDIGFQLSFLATGGIILFRERIFSFFKFLPKFLSDDLATTLAAQSLVIPVLFYHFGSVSAISPVANAAVLWTIPFATIAGFIFLAASFILPIFATAISWAIWALLSTFVFIIEMFGHLSFAYFEFAPNQLLPLIIYYLVLMGVFVLLKYVGVAKAKQQKG